MNGYPPGGLGDAPSRCKGLRDKLNYNLREVDNSSIVGGGVNTINGNFSVIPGGKNNEITGDYSLGYGNAVQCTLDYVAAFYCDSLPGKLGINNPNPHSTLQANGSFATAYIQVTSDTTLGESHFTVFANDSLTVTIPPPGDCGGRIYVIRNIHTSSPVRVQPSSGNIEAASYIDIIAGEGIMIQSAGGTNWYIIADYD